MFVLLLTMEMRNYRLETCCIILVFLALNAGAVFESIEMVAETANQQDAQVHVQHLQEQRHQEQQKEDDRKDDGKTCGSGSFATHGASNSSESRQLDKNNGQGQCMDVVKEECDTLVAKYDGSREKACIEFFSYMQTSCRKTCLLCENVDKNEHQVSNIYSEQPQNVETRSQDDIMDLVAKVDDYMYNQVYNQDDPNHKVWQKVKYDCKNQNANCIKWAKMGECDNNPSFMKKSCGPSCFTCDLLDIDTRCPFDRHAPQTYSKSGELDAMFTRMVTQADLQQKYTVTILSQPAPPTTTTTMVEDCGGNDNDVDVTNSKPQGGPWVVLLDDFLTEEECDTLIALGTKQGYERSQEFNGGLKPDGSMESYVSKGRTSSQTCTCRAFMGVDGRQTDWGLALQHFPLMHSLFCSFFFSTFSFLLGEGIPRVFCFCYTSQFLSSS